MATERNRKLNKLKNKTLYKYLPSKYVNDFINKGEILFRNLTYFNNCEYNKRIGDIGDGGLRHNPINGFEVWNTTKDSVIKLKDSFAYTNTDNIFAFCVSEKLDNELFKEFDCDCCIEITNPAEFTKRIGRSLRYKYFDFDNINYYNTSDNLQHLINKPETIPFYKTIDYESQNEYRYLFSETKIKLEILFSTLPLTDEQILELKTHEKEDKLVIGSLTDIAKPRFFHEL